MASEASSISPGDLPNCEKSSADFPQTRRQETSFCPNQLPACACFSFMSVAPVPGAPQPLGAMGAALSNVCLSVDERQPSWIKGAEQCGQLIKAHQLPFVCT